MQINKGVIANKPRDECVHPKGTGQLICYLLKEITSLLMNIKDIGYTPLTDMVEPSVVARIINHSIVRRTGQP